MAYSISAVTAQDWPECFVLNSASKENEEQAQITRPLIS